MTGWVFEGALDNDQRALSGQSLERHLRYSASHHDNGEKTVLARRGRWSGDDLVRLLLDQPATADRLAWRIASEFLGEGVATPEERAALAEELRTSGLDIGAAVARVLRSERFFADDTVGRRVPGPVEWAVAAVRRFLPLDPPPSLVRLAEWSARMGQGLFYPPNVGGWPGGRAWLSPLALLGRANLAADLIAGRLARPAGKPLDLLGLALRHGCGGGREKLVRFLTDLILGGMPDEGWTDRILATAVADREPGDFARRSGSDSRLPPGPAWVIRVEQLSSLAAVRRTVRFCEPPLNEELILENAHAQLDTPPFPAGQPGRCSPRSPDPDGAALRGPRRLCRRESRSRS